MENVISVIGQIAITVSSVDIALSFYRDILGLKFLFSPSTDLAFLSCSATRIMLTTPQGSGEIGKNSILYFKTTNIEDFYTNIVELGAKVEREPQLAARMSDHQLWIGFVRDPDGNLVGLMEEKREAN
jgi:predicted enzyme related to lactoylglutathione lyase